MNRTATSSFKRLAAVVLFTGGPALIAAFIVINALQIADDNLSMAEKQSQIAALTRRANATARDGKPVDLSAIYIPGASRSLANANLQQHLVDAVSATSGKLLETTVIDPGDADTSGETNNVRLKVTLDIDNNGLLQFLYRIESGLPLLDVETLSVRRLQDDADKSSAIMLRVDIGVKGRWRQRPA